VCVMYVCVCVCVCMLETEYRKYQISWFIEIPINFSIKPMLNNGYQKFKGKKSPLRIIIKRTDCMTSRGQNLKNWSISSRKQNVRLCRRNMKKAGSSVIFCWATNYSQIYWLKTTPKHEWPFGYYAKWNKLLQKRQSLCEPTYMRDQEEWNS
jgi:hypothetical protein